MQSIFDLRRLPLLCFVLRRRCRCRLAFGLCSRKPRSFRGHRRGRRLDRPLFFGGQTRSLRAFLKLKIRGRPLSHALARALDPIFGLRRLLFSRGILRCVGSPLFVALDLREPNSFGNRRVSRPLLGFNLRKPRLLRSRRLGGGLYRLLLFCGDARSLLALFKFKVRCRQLRLALARVLQPIFDLRRLSLLRRFLRRSRLPVGFDLRKPRSFRRRRFGGGLYRLLLFCGEACGLLALFKFKIRGRQLRGVLARVLQPTFDQRRLSLLRSFLRRSRLPVGFDLRKPRSFRSRRFSLYRLLLFCSDACGLLALFKFKVRGRQLRLALARVLQPIFELRRLSLLRRFLRRSRLPVGFNLRKPRSFRSRRFGLHRLLLFCSEACGLLALFLLQVRGLPLSRTLTRALKSIFGLRRLSLPRRFLSP